VANDKTIPVYHYAIKPRSFALDKQSCQNIAMLNPEIAFASIAAHATAYGSISPDNSGYALELAETAGLKDSLGLDFQEAAVIYTLQTPDKAASLVLKLTSWADHDGDTPKDRQYLMVRDLIRGKIRQPDEDRARIGTPELLDRILWTALTDQAASLS
jgi:hypothetical protein